MLKFLASPILQMSIQLLLYCSSYVILWIQEKIKEMNAIVTETFVKVHNHEIKTKIYYI